MNRLLVTLLFSFSLIAFQCDMDDLPPKCPDCQFTCLASGEPDVLTNACKNNYTCAFELHPNSKLQYTNDVLDNYIKSGNKLVFRASADTQGSPTIADDEFTDLLYFEIDPSLESFSVENGELDLLNVRFQQLCFCADVKAKKPASGCMEGQRIDDQHWRVQANLKIQYDSWSKEVKLDAVFKK